MTKKLTKGLFALSCILIGLYPIAYFFMDKEMGLLATKSKYLLEDAIWNLGFYSHIIFGGIALLIGWAQFSKRLRKRSLKWHRRVGRIYVATAMISGIASIYIGFFATGGWIATAGFVSLGIVWLYTTFIAYSEAKNGRILEHQKMMYYSYAACFAAVTLRIFLPMLTNITGDFFVAYRIIAWMCWVPNIIVAYFLVKRIDVQAKIT